MRMHVLTYLLTYMITYLPTCLRARFLELPGCSPGIRRSREMRMLHPLPKLSFRDTHIDRPTRPTDPTEFPGHTDRPTDVGYTS